MRRQSCNMEVFYCIIVLALLGQASSDPHFTSKPNKQTEAFYGENVNFTWKYSDHPFLRGTFGLFSSIHNMIETQMFAIDRLPDGTESITALINKLSKDYHGRLRWVGSLANRTLSFELSHIKYEDKRFYGIEIDFDDDEGTTIAEYTKLIVKVPSTFGSSPGMISLLRGETAEFTWKYDLNEEDKKSLRTVLFGVYRQNRFDELCRIEVKTVKAGCSRKSKAHILNMVPKKEVTFQLSQIDLDDEATYVVRLVGTQRPMENGSRLIVQDPPKFTKQPVAHLTVNEHKPLNLSCAAYGKPTPTITWYKDDHVIQVDISGAYFVNNTRKEDAGKYYCVAENEVGNDTSSSVAVDVQYLPIINKTTTNKMKVVHKPIGRKVQFQCPALANPPATIQWFHDSLDSKINGPTLEVEIRSRFDYGNYTCRAKNLLGKDEASFVLEQVGPPLTPKVDCEKKQAGGSHSKTRMFRWVFPEDNGGAPVLRFTVKRRKLGDNNHRQPWVDANITRDTWYTFAVEWKTAYEVTATAWNVYGESKLDSDNTCIYTIGQDPALYNTDSTTMPITEPTVVAAPRGDSNDDQNVMVYVGICIALLALIAVVVMLIVYRIKKNRPKKSINHQAHQNMSYDRVLSVESGGSWDAGDKLLGSIPRTRTMTMVGSPSYQLDPEWSIPREKICIMKVIGNGAFGLVYKGRVHGVGSNTVGWSIVAIKSPYADATDSEVRDLMKEFELLKSLKSHPHVIKLLGCGEDEGRPLIIIEYVPFGDLLGYLRKSRGEEDDYYSDPEMKPNTHLSSQQLLRFAWHVTDGMTFLASEKIIHRDLAARNVLVGEGMSCKVTDFGMARDVSNDDIYLRTTEGRLPVKWTAIEALTGSGEYTTQSDVWSFGVVLYEICTIGADPYPGITGKEIPERLDSGYRMPRPGHVDPELYEVMMSCWKTDPEERPTFPELKEKLVKLEAVQSRDYINLSECLYQNVTVTGSVKGPKRRSLLGLSKNSKKEPAKGNDYQEGPPGLLPGHVITAV